MIVKRLKEILQNHPDDNELFIEHEGEVDYLKRDVIYQDLEYCLTVSKFSLWHNKYCRYLINEGFVEIEFDPDKMIRNTEQFSVTVGGLQFEEQEWVSVCERSNFRMYVIPVQSEGTLKYFVRE